MLRQSLACCLIFVTLAACEQETRIGALQARAPAPAAPPAFTSIGQDRVPDTVLITGSLIGPPAPKLAYTHNLAIEMADAMVAPRFERGRIACLEDRSLSCNLLEASITVGNPNTGIRPTARLSVRLPHASVDSFKSLLLEPLPEEAPGEPSLRRSSTNAEDLTFQISDTERRLAQATDYRERLTVLSRRGDAKVDELIKVQQTLSEVQSSIEEMTIETRQLNTRVDTELLNISLAPYEPLTSVASPLGSAWRDAARALGESTASAFLFVVVLLPWLPLVALGGAALVWLWRFMRKGRRQKGSVSVA